MAEGGRSERGGKTPELQLFLDQAESLVDICDTYIKENKVQGVSKLRKKCSAELKFLTRVSCA